MDISYVILGMRGNIVPPHTAQKAGNGGLDTVGLVMLDDEEGPGGWGRKGEN